MNFSFDQDSLDLREGVRQFLRARCNVDYLRALRDGEENSLSLWPELVELGLPGFMAPASCGGLAMPLHALALIAEECGVVALPAPLLELAGVAVPLLAELDSGHTLCQALVEGKQLLHTSHAQNPYVNGVTEADHLLRIEEEKIRLLSPSQFKLREQVSIDPLRQLAALELAEDAGQLLLEGEAAAAVSAAAALRGAVLTAAELLGLSSAMLAMASDYARERQQFGNPIGSYQAVKHLLAGVAVDIEFARPVIYRAAVLADGGADAAQYAVAHAKHAATRTAYKAAEAAIQVHGGMGYTYEVDLHLWMKRCWALAALWGDQHAHYQRLDHAVFNSDASGAGKTFSVN